MLLWSWQTAAINYANMSSRGLLIRGADGLSKPSAQGNDFIDAFNPETRKYMFDQLVDGYISHGIDTFWVCLPRVCHVSATCLLPALLDLLCRVTSVV
eukprot:COSAG06_NODE_2253_length_7231_cov_5.051178_3_plen_98_part_00